MASAKASGRITKAILAKLESNPHEEGLAIEVVFLEKILIQAKEAYFNTDKPLFTDASYDILENCLKARKPESKLFKLTGAKVDETHDKVKLKYYLGSLDKVKPNEKVLTKWLKDHTPKDTKNSILISEKLDGLSCLLIIEKQDKDTGNKDTGNKDKQFKMFLYKHGDGNEGQEITPLLEHINLGKLNTITIQKVLEKADHIAIRGEIIMSKDMFSKKYTKQYPKARSLIAGIVNSKKPESNIIKDMEIVFYEYIAPDHLKYEDQFKMLEKMGVNIARYTIYDTIIESQLPEILIDYKKQSKYEIDGIILTDNTKPHNRVMSGNPSYAVAFKMPLEEQMANTVVLNVEYNISKHGALNPRIMYKPVVIGGDTHQYTSGFNLRYIVDNKIGIGAEIQIIKSGDVIPYIYSILKSAKEAQMPDKELKWHWNDTQVDAIIDNIEDNEDVNTKRIIAFFEVMKIAGVSDGVVKKFVNAGYNEVKTILQLTPDIIASLEGFQLKSATNVYNSIHKIIDNPQKLERVMMASNVFGLGLGEKKFKLIIDAMPNFLEKWKKGKITKDDIMSIDGFSDKSTDIFIKGMPKFLEWLELHKMIKIINLEESASGSSGSSSSATTNTKFANMSIVFTGVRNAEMEDAITNGGGKIGSGITGKTTLVVAKDINESSSKLNTAREKGIQIMSIDDFAKKYGFM
jgi:NAD-dependent DNA ligase